MLNATIAALCLIAGVVLGFTAPRWGLALLVGYVAVTSSLAWQLGAANLATPFLFAIGFLASLAARHRDLLRAGIGGAPDVGPIRTAAYLLVGSVVVATALGLIRNGLTGQADASLASLIIVFNPPGFAGALQTMLITVSGPLLLLAAIGLLRDPATFSAFPRWFAIGAGLAVITPLIQILAMDPSVRPDLDSSFSIGYSGFFQDPHSYAAYLVLAACFCVGMAGAAWHRGERGGALVCGALAIGALVVLLYTGSRTGLLAALVGLAATLTLAALRIGGIRGSRRMPRFAVAALGTGLLLALVVFLIEPVQRLVYRVLSPIGSPLIWDPLSARVSVAGLLETRGELWKAALDALAARPLWGLGANGMTRLLAAQDSAVQNVHNYYLQLGADYGVPATLCFIVLLALVMMSLIGGLRVACARDALLLAGVCGGVVGMGLVLVLSHPLLLAEIQAAFWTLVGWGLVAAQRAAGDDETDP